MRRLTASVALLAAIVAWLATGKAVAAPANPLTGIAISPAVQQLVLAPGQKSFTFTVQLYNYTDLPVSIQLSSADFTSLNQTGGLSFLGSSPTAAQKAHGLSSALKLPAKPVTLAPQSSQPVSISISNSAVASGGHYAAVLARLVSQSTAPTANKVVLNQLVSSLVFVETAGQGTKTLITLPPAIDKLQFSLPTSINLFFQATGDTQTVPRGIVSVERQLASPSPSERGIINPDSSLLLPGSTRLLPTTLYGRQHPWWPGKYYVDIQYRYDGALGVSDYRLSFLYVNPLTILVIVMVLTVTIGLLAKFIKLIRRQHSAHPVIE